MSYFVAIVFVQRPLQNQGCQKHQGHCRHQEPETPKTIRHQILQTSIRTYPKFEFLWKLITSLASYNAVSSVSLSA